LLSGLLSAALDGDGQALPVTSDMEQQSRRNGKENCDRQKIDIPQKNINFEPRLALLAGGSTTWTLKKGWNYPLSLRKYGNKAPKGDHMDLHSLFKVPIDRDFFVFSCYIPAIF
jgi:hypothetical protein